MTTIGALIRRTTFAFLMSAFAVKADSEGEVPRTGKQFSLFESIITLIEPTNFPDTVYTIP